MATAMNWELTYHASARMIEMGVDDDELLETLGYPSITYPSPPSYGPGRLIAVAGRLAIVHNPSTRTVITVLWHGRSDRSMASAA